MFKTKDIFNLPELDDDEYRQMVIKIQPSMVSELEEIFNEYEFTGCDFNLSLMIRSAVTYFLEAYRGIERF